MLISQYEFTVPKFFNNPAVLFHEVFTLLFCVGYLPFSKLFHMFVTPLVIMINKGGYIEINPEKKRLLVNRRTTFISNEEHGKYDDKK